MVRDTSKTQLTVQAVQFTMQSNIKMSTVNSLMPNNLSIENNRAIN